MSTIVKIFPEHLWGYSIDYEFTRNLIKCDSRFEEEAKILVNAFEKFEDLIQK